MRLLLIFSLLLALCASHANAQVSDSLRSPLIEREPVKDEFIESASLPVAIDTLSKILVYPETAKRAGIEGEVLLSALVGSDGTVLRVRIDKSTNFIFEKPAKDAMHKMHYKPALSNGKPMKVWVNEIVQFRLH